MTVSIDRDFGIIADLVHAHALEAPQRQALIDGAHSLTYGELDAQVDNVAWALQRDGLRPGDAIAICAGMSIRYALVFLGALRAGVVVAPLAPGAGAHSLQRMTQDARARLLFVDAVGAQALGPESPGSVMRIALDGSDAGQPLVHWSGPAGMHPDPVEIQPSWPFNIIYSSGTTGAPKGIVQPHSMRWAHVRRGAAYAYASDMVSLVSTPLYSNTTLVVFFPTLAAGGTLVLMPKFDVAGFLQLASTHRVTHAMLVPVQYQRLMAYPGFDAVDLSAFRMKFCTSAPFSAALKADVLKRWPGGLVEYYGMTEGGGTCILEAHNFSDKLHTVGRPAQGHEIRLIDDNGVEVAPGESGEVVGRSGGMMTGYHGQPERTREAEWFDPQGVRFIRTGDIGRFDTDGFLTLLDRKKDMLISGGFNVYPSDLEAVLRAHPAVQEVAVVGVPSPRWGETPVAFVVQDPHATSAVTADALLQWANAQLGKTQRLDSVQCIDALPRSSIGKVLKRELRERFTSGRNPRQ
ncbi:MAG: acyl--CoA ligase [Rhodoferax sp.]|nr:acyl--CoA ligase [Rhodoferax sp.]